MLQHVKCSAIFDHYTKLGVDVRCVTPDAEVSGVNSIDQATSNEFTFCKYSGEKGILKIQSTKSNFLFVPSKTASENLPNKNYIFVENPRLEFIKFIHMQLELTIHKN